MIVNFEWLHLEALNQSLVFFYGGKVVLSCSKKLRILLVEDTSFIQLVMKCMLENMNCFVSVACSGEEAVKKFSPAIDGVLMDLGLPDIDGYQTTRKIQEKYPYHSSCIYACSAFDRDVESACRDSGMVGFIQKPCLYADIQQFLDEVRKKNISDDSDYAEKN